MKKTAQMRLAPALAGLGLIGLLCLPLLPAQAQGGPQQPGGRFGRRIPFAFGTVTAVDAAAGTITLSSPFGGGSQTIQATQGTTQIVSQTTATVSDLKVGDQVQVQGIPTGITASSVTVGQSPLPTMGGGRGFGGPGAPGGQGGTAASGTPIRGQANATGTVTSTKPLTISLGQGISMTLTLTANAKISKYSPVALSSIRVGDQIVGAGQTGTDGIFAATSVGVNVTMGMGQGGGGFGGPGGGFGGPGGGFGGRGGRGANGFGQRGGFGGGPGGFGGGPGGFGGGPGGQGNGGPGNADGGPAPGDVTQ